MEPREVLATADSLIHGEKREEYGGAEDSFTTIAQGWSSITASMITPREVALMMIWLKITREINKGKDDNLVDICGYAALAAKLK